jgi:hypothetical protein
MTGVRVLVVVVAVLCCGGRTEAALADTVQKPATKKPATTTKTPTTKKPAPVPARVAEAPEVTCPQVLGTGVGSRLRFCDVMTGLDPAQGIVVRFPPHEGPLTLSFDLHNRHTYSEQEVQAGRAFAQYTATVGALAMDGTLIARGVVQSEFRTARDLFDRVGGGAGPGGVKAVAPTGMERIVVEIPAGVNEVGILGEKLSVTGLNGTDLFTSANRPIAVVSNFSIDYKPAKKPAPKPTRKPVKK